MELREKVVWLTGASSGIGAALVKELIKEGCRVALTSRRVELLEELANPYQKEKKVRIYPGDVRDRERMKQIVKEIREEWGRIEVSIFNAGSHHPLKVKAFDSKVFEEIMAINYFGVVYGIEAVLPEMLEQGSGHLVAVSSVAGYRGLPTAAPYCGSKAALITMLESLRFDLRRYGIGVIIVNPGFIETPMTADNDFYMPFLRTPEFAAKKIVRGLKRGSKEIHFPWQMTWIMKGLRILPYPIYERLFYLAGKQIKEEKKEKNS